MAQSVLFGYTVEEVDGSLVIKISGTMAATILQDITAQVGRDAGNISAAPMAFPFSALASQAVQMMPQHGISPSETKLDLKEIFGQGFDSNYSEFDEQLARYRDVLSVSSAQTPEQSAGGDGQTKTSLPGEGGTKALKKP